MIAALSLIGRLVRDPASLTLGIVVDARPGDLPDEDNCEVVVHWQPLLDGRKTACQWGSLLKVRAG